MTVAHSLAYCPKCRQMTSHRVESVPATKPATAANITSTCAKCQLTVASSQA